MNFLTTAIQHMHTKAWHLKMDDKWRSYTQLEKYETMLSHATAQFPEKKNKNKKLDIYL